MQHRAGERGKVPEPGEEEEHRPVGNPAGHDRFLADLHGGYEAMQEKHITHDAGNIEANVAGGPTTDKKEKRKNPHRDERKDQHEQPAAAEFPNKILLGLFIRARQPSHRPERWQHCGTNQPWRGDGHKHHDGGLRTKLLGHKGQYCEQ